MTGSDVGRDGIPRPIGNRPCLRRRHGPGRLPIGRRLTTCPTLLILALAACSSKQHVAGSGPAIAPVLQRQIANATDAGDGDYQTRALRKRVLDNPDDISARMELADRYWKAGVVELAIEHYRFAADRFPDNARVAILLARALRDADHSPEALAALVKFCNRNAKASPDLLSLLGILQDDAGQFSEAERAYRAALEQEPQRPDLRNNLGYNLLLQGKPALAAAQFEEAIKLDPRSQLAHDNLGLALLAQWKDDSQPKEALLHWQSVSDPASAHNNLAAVLIEQGRYADARKELEIALSYRKDHAEALKNLKLVSELDGGSAKPPQTAHNSFWHRVRTVFTGRKPLAVETASKGS